MPEFCFMDQEYDEKGHVIVNQEHSKELKLANREEPEVIVALEENKKLVGKTDKVKFVKNKDKEDTIR